MSQSQLEQLKARLIEMQDEAWGAGCETVSEMFPHYQSMCARKRELETQVWQENYNKQHGAEIDSAHAGECDSQGIGIYAR